MVCSPVKSGSWPWTHHVSMSNPTLYWTIVPLALFRLRVLSCSHVWVRAEHSDTGSMWAEAQRTVQRTRLSLTNMSSLLIHYNYHSTCTPFWLCPKQRLRPSYSPTTCQHCCTVIPQACGSVAHFHTSPWQQQPTKKAVVEKAVDGLKEKKSKSVVDEQEAKVQMAFVCAVWQCQCCPHS